VKKITQEWIAKAEEDYLVATRELKADPPALDAVCFHAQQCGSFIPELRGYRDDLIRISAYAVDIRYPGFRVSEEEAKECVDSMEKIQQVIRNHFKI
jgi:HEPN domain-containing protein